MRILFRICSMLSLAALISCSSSGQPARTETLASSAPIATTEQTPPAEVSEATGQQVGIVQPLVTTIPKTKLIKNLTYTGGEKKLTIQGQEYPSAFVEIDLHPYGFYIPDTMQEFVYEDGSEIGLNKSEFIAMSEVDRLVHPDNPHESLKFGGEILFQDKDLMQYEEYIGSAGDGGGGTRVDGFVLKHDNTPDMLLYFLYFNRNKEKVLPVFLEVARNIKYIEQKPGS
ncbi:hypothetical protein GC101_30120 [Paenibacillus sp. LMG 31459]|uniref:Lipoprotein n=1 Tax=Paenibacillus phytohabitans TaxID=2654978 RepID=A0ABX1YTI4_9BACL|nr:hypothetical protein [Paenibacillus phytohabitans]NOU83123.1 hypothetical protein [Paenibacillus phytohabitans]